jgi:hypothetical protein
VLLSVVLDFKTLHMSLLFRLSHLPAQGSHPFFRNPLHFLAFWHPGGQPLLFYPVALFQSQPQPFHGYFPITQLGAVLGSVYHNAGGQVSDPHG